MPERPSSFGWAVVLAKVWSVGAYASLLVVFAAVSVVLLSAARTGAMGKSEAFLLWLAVMVIVPTAALGVTVVRGLAQSLVRGGDNVQTVVDRINRLESVTEALHDTTRRLVDLSQMSDAAKSLVFRQGEVEAMDEVLHEHLIRQDYAGADRFVSEMETRLGRTEQAAHMRQEIAAARTTTIEQKVESALNRIRKLVEEHDWEQAVRLTRRLIKVQPDNPRVRPMPQSIRESRAKHKLQLLEDYGEAVKRSDIDRSIELLHELDKYLTPQEAAALQESVRGVFRAKLLNLGVQFAMRVTEQNWAEALEIGEQIVQDFPNSRMAEEFRQKFDRLTALASGQAQQ